LAFDQVLAGRVRALLDDVGPIREVKMFGGLTFMLNGHMCCGVAGKDLIVRLGPEGAAAAIEDGLARIFAPTGKAASGMASVDAAAGLDRQTLQAWIGRAVVFVTSLPVKS
jgi:TfoX/Sxy family transcriptional regulator of competence genes